MVKGRLCNQRPFHEEACAYPIRVGNILNHLFVDQTADPFQLHFSSQETTNHIKVSNLARRGMPLPALLPSLYHILKMVNPPPTAIFVDFTVNDEQVAVETLKQSVEAMVRFMRRTFPSPELYFIQSYCSPHARANFNGELGVLRYYDIPVISYSSSMNGSSHCSSKMVWGYDSLSSPPPPTNAHPPWFIHQNIAYVIVQGLVTRFLDLECGNDHKKREIEINQSLPSPIYPSSSLHKVCSPLTYYDANEIFISGNTSGIHIYGKDEMVKDGRWELREDRKDKAGWISSLKNSIIEFDVIFGSSNPRLIVGYLKSYEKMGKVTVSFPSLSGNGKDVELDGLDEMTHSSQIFPFDITPKNTNKIGRIVPAFNTKTKVRFKTTNNEKFKLSYVISC